MQSPLGCLGTALAFLRGQETTDENDHNGPKLDSSQGAYMNMLPSVEIFSLPGHGRTSFLWAMLFLLRQLSRVWPRYRCWPIDESTGSSLLKIHEALRLGHLPDRWSFNGGPDYNYALHLTNMNPWGERHFIVRDAPDTAFSSEHLDAEEKTRLIDWNRPAFWLLSLSDLDEVRGRFLDLELDQLIRARHASGEAAREYPFRLVVVLTKGDAITDLPTELRCFLKEDPLAKALAAGKGGIFRAHDQVDVQPPPAGLDSYPEGDPLNAYFQARRLIDEMIRDWLSSNSSGRALLARAADLDVDLRLSVVSATGSGFVSDGQLGMAWSPRRILDPYFWSLELGA